MQDYYVRITKELSERAIIHFQRIIEESEKIKPQCEELKALLDWQDKADHVRYVPTRDTCGAYHVFDNQRNAPAIKSDGKPIPVASYGSAWETCKMLNEEERQKINNE